MRQKLLGELEVGKLDDTVDQPIALPNIKLLVCHGADFTTRFAGDMKCLGGVELRSAVIGLNGRTILGSSP